MIGFPRKPSKAVYAFLVVLAVFPMYSCRTRNGPQDSEKILIKWVPGPNTPVAMMEGPCIQVGSKLFVMGGYTRQLNVTNQANVLDLDSLKWESIPSLPQAQTHVGIATDGSYLYLVGGQLGGDLSTDIRSEAFRYDIANKKWSEFSPLPEPRAGGALVYLNGDLHYFAGDLKDRVTVSNKHWAIPVSGEGGWVERGPLIHPGDHIGSCVLDSKIYAIGGEHGHGSTYNQHNSVSQYDAISNAWTSRAPLPKASSHFESSVVMVHGRILVLGGQGDSQQVLSDVRFYDPVSDRWTVGSSLPYALKGGAAAFHKDRIYFATGRGTIQGKYQSTEQMWVGTIQNPWWNGKAGQATK